MLFRVLTHSFPCMFPSLLLCKFSSLERLEKVHFDQNVIRFVPYESMKIKKKILEKRGRGESREEERRVEKVKPSPSKTFVREERGKVVQ